MPVRVKAQNVLHLNVKAEAIKYIQGYTVKHPLWEYVQENCMIRHIS